MKVIVLIKEYNTLRAYFKNHTFECLEFIDFSVSVVEELKQ
jgi:hypothetical protein